VSAVAHHLKPALRDRPQFAGMLMHPDFDSWISLDRTGKPQKLAHGNFISTLRHRAGIRARRGSPDPAISPGRKSPVPAQELHATNFPGNSPQDANSLIGALWGWPPKNA